MLKRIAIIFFFILVLTLPAFAEEIMPPSAKTGEIHGNQLMLGVTDGTSNDLMMFRTDTNGYLMVNGMSSGSTTPSDAYTNPTDAMKSFSLLGARNGTTWDMLRTAYTDGMPATGILGVGLMGWNGMGFDRVAIDGNDAIYVNPGALGYASDNVAVFPPQDTQSKYISTATSSAVKGSAGHILRVVVGVAGAASTTAILYDKADCTSPTTVLGVIDTSQMSSLSFSMPFAAGLCVVTDGTPKITVVYR